MRRLNKGESPDVLSRNYAQWTRELLSKIAAGMRVGEAVGQRYAHRDIKSALLSETHDKCAYCESKLTHISYGDIEHIVAKAADPSRAFDWLNLTIACDKCNQNKGDSAGVIDPYEIDPSDHLVFVGPLVKGRPESDLGLFTERKLDLNRAQLVEKRAERIDYIFQMAGILRRVTDPALYEVMIRDIRSCAEPTQEYSAMVEACLPACLA